MRRFYLSTLVLLLLITGSDMTAQAQTTFNYTGAVQSWTVPTGASSIAVDAYGGCGGSAYHSGGGNPVTKGGRVQCVMAVTAGQVLYIYVGGQGGSYSISQTGGWNGGANSGGTFCAAGGGATDIRLSNIAVGTYTPTNRVVVAGAGGGGGDFDAAGGPGGGLIGADGAIYSTYVAHGGSQVAAGTNSYSSAYTGFIGAGGPAGGSSGGGGGGLWGGAGGFNDGGGGGGSSYTDPGLCTSVVHTQGYTGAVGNGRLTITVLCNTPVHGTITGSTAICGSPGITSALGITSASSSPDGIWSSTNTSVATIGSTGLVTVVGSGAATIKFSVSRSCGSIVDSAAFTAYPLPVISGSANVCTANGTTLSTSIPGGAWTSSAPSIAIVGSSSGIVSGLLAGNVATITYTTANNCKTSMNVAVNNSPAPAVGNAIVCAGLTTNLADPISGGTWTSSNAAVATINPSSGVISGLTNGTSSITYTLPSGCYTTTVATVNQLPVVRTVSLTGGAQYCAGGSGVHIQLNNSSASTTYQAYNGTVASGAAVPGNSLGTALDLGLFTAGTYTVVATSTTTGCINNMTGSATVTSIALPSLFNLGVTGSSSYCIGSGTGVQITLAGSQPSSDNISYQLSLGGTPVGAALMGNGSALNFPLQTTPGSYMVTATTPTLSCSSVMPGVAAVSALPQPAVHNVSGSGGYCQGGTGRVVSLDVTDHGVDYHLYLNGSSLITDGPSLLSGTGVGNDFGLHTGLGSYTVVAENQTTHCTANMAGSAVVFIHPAIAANPVSVTGTGSYCSGTAAPHILMSTSTNVIQYQLNNGSVNIGAPVTSTGSNIDFGPVPTSGAYQVIATNPITTCTAIMPGTATITELALPTAFVVTGGSNYCSGGNGVHITLSGSEFNVNYQLYNNGNPLSGSGDILPGSISESAIDFGARTGSGSYTVKALNTVTGCSNAMNGNTVIAVNPLPAPFAITGGGSYCSGGAGAHVGLAFSSTGVSYQLYRNGSSIGYLPVTGTGAALDLGTQPAGTYVVVATNALTTCSLTMPGNVSVNTIPAPSVFPVTGGGSYCSGAPGVRVGLGASNSGVRYELYNGMLPAGIILTGTGSALDFGLQSASGVYTIVANNPTTTCTSNMVGSATVVVNPVPVTATVTGGGPVCAGSTGLPIGIDNSDPTVNYQLYKGTTPVGAAQQGIGTSFDFGTYSSAGTYKVIATDPLTHCSSNMSGTAIISINPLPAVYNVAGGGSYCFGGTGVDIRLNGSSAGISYQLNNGATPVMTLGGNGGALDFGLQTTGGNYNVVATNPATLCSSNMAAGAMVTVNPLPHVDSIVGGGSYCYGGIGVTIAMSAGVAGVNYQLFKGATPVSGPLYSTGSPVHFGYVVDGGTYTVMATNVATSCSTQMAGTAPVNVIPYVTPSISVSSDTGYSLCEGTAVLFTATPVYGGTTPTYQWSVNGSFVGLNADTFSYVPSNGDRVAATLTSSEACLTSPNVSNTVMMTMHAVGMPAVTVTSSDSAVCAGTSVVFSAAPEFGGSAPVYSWFKNGNLVPDVNAPSYSYVPQNGDNVYCKIMSNYMCRTADSQFSNHVAMTVNQPATPTFSVTASGARIGRGDWDTLTAVIISGGGPNPTYQWLVNGTPVVGQNGPVYISKGFYDRDSVTCIVTGSGVCGGTSVSHSKILSVRSVGVQAITSSASDISLMPNPNNGTFTIKGRLGINVDEEVTLEVTNMLGQIVYHNSLMSANGNIESQIQLSNSLAKGMYLLNVRTATENNVFHFAVEK